MSGSVPCRTLRSLLEEFKEPSGANHVGSQGLRPPPQLAIRCDEGDDLIGGVRGDIDEQVVSGARSMKHRHSVAHATLDAIASLAF